MNRKLVISLLCCTAILFVLSLGNENGLTEEARYVPREQVGDKALNGGYQDYLASIHKNNLTGQVEPGDFLKGRAQAEKFALQNQRKSVNLVWEERGPDNVGGRTRAIHIIESSPNQVYAGGVTGGLWYSSTLGDWWQQVSGFNTNLAVSSIARTNNGRLYVATGCDFDSPSGTGGSGSFGNGIWFTDELGVNASFTILPNSQPTTLGPGLKSTWNRIVADVNEPDKLWAGGNDGLYTYTDATGFVEFTRVEAGTNNTGNFGLINDIVMSTDGQTIIVGEVSGGVRTWISYNGGATWRHASDGNGANGSLSFGGAGRMTYAISPDDKNYMYAVQVSSGNGGPLRNIWRSIDGGMTWLVIAVGGNETFDPFRYIGTTIPAQGIYDQTVIVVPGDKNRVLVGGIFMWEWKQAGNDPAAGSWEQSAALGNICGSCVHADLHTFTYSPTGELYIGTDGGVYRSPDLETYYPSNRGYNVTQFYAMDFTKDNGMLGGTQDNGTQLVDGSGMTWQEGSLVRGGDGFECEVSHLNNDVMFSSLYNGDITRSDDGGGNWDNFYDDDLQNWLDNGAAGSTFYTTMAYWENENDPMSQDSISVVVNQDILPGDTIYYTSASIQTPLEYVATMAYDSLDTLRLVDPVQSLFAAAVGSNGVQITRDAIRFGKQPNWIQVLDVNALQGYTVHRLEFSNDGNTLYAGTRQGRLFVVSNLQSVYDDTDTSALVVSNVVSPLTAVLTDIAVDPRDPDHVVITYGGFGIANVFESFNATDPAGGTYTSIVGNLPSSPYLPVYAAMIDRENEDLIVIGTEYGVYASNDGGNTWADQNGTMERVPVFDIKQQTRSWDQGAFNPGMIYLATHGRGFWSSASLLSTGPIKPWETNEPTATVDLKPFPNPATEQATIPFVLGEPSAVSLEVIDMNGRVVQVHETRGTSGENVIVLDVNRLSQGTYLLSLRHSEGISTGKLLVK